LCVLLGALVLTGCGKTDTAVPDEVRQMMNADFPADGQIHVQSRGKFDIKPDTLFCYYDSGPSISAGDVLRALKQSYYAGTVKREMLANNPMCSPPKDSVFSAGEKTENHQGKPYKLMLAVWQGDPARGGAAWVGGIERTDGVRPDANLDTLPIGDDLAILGPSRDEQRRKARTESSIALDFSDITISFTKTVKGK
jgi:hypothetical protein